VLHTGLGIGLLVEEVGLSNAGKRGEHTWCAVGELPQHVLSDKKRGMRGERKKE
jgi:hypothetical protein